MWRLFGKVHQFAAFLFSVAILLISTAALGAPKNKTSSPGLPPAPFTSNEPNTITCFAGDPGSLALEKQLTGASKTNPDYFLNAWRSKPRETKARFCHEGEPESKAQQTHQDLGEQAITALKKVGPPQRYIKKSCIEMAVRRISNLPDKMLTCSTETGSAQQLRFTPCVSENYVDYVYWTVNQALKCLSPAGDPIDPQMIFAKINNESAFATFIQSSSGMGAAQLTTSGAEEMSVGEPGFDFLMQQLNSSDPTCRAFRKIAELPLQRTGRGGSARHCQFVSTGGGVPRSFLKGIGLYLYYRQGMNRSVHERLERLGMARNPNFAKMRDYVALVAFSSAGPAGAAELVDKLKGRIGPKTSFESFKKLVDDRAAYTKAVNAKMKEVFGSANFDCTEDAE